MHRSLRPFAAFLACLLARPLSAQTTLYWDTNGATAGASAGTTAAGAWGFGPMWSTSSDGTGATQSWTNGSNAVFSAGTNATGAFTVTLPGLFTANKVSFLQGTVTLQDSALLNYLTVPEVEVGSGLTATIDAYLRPAAGFVKSGSGDLTLAGQIYMTSSHPFTVSGGNVTVSGSGTVFTPIFGIDLLLGGAAGTSFSVAGGATVSTGTLQLNDQLAFQVGVGGTLALDYSGRITTGTGTPTFTLAGGTLSASDNNTVSLPVALASGTTSNVSPSSTASIVLLNGLTGSGALNLTGPGALTVYGDNSSFSGGTTLTSGTLAIGHANALGTGPLTFAGGSLYVQGVSPTYTPFVIQNGSATVTGGGTVLSSTSYVETGNGGTGVLNISNGGRVNAASSVVAGIGTSGNGTINVDGSGSFLEVGTFFAAGYAAGTTGTLALTNSASATIGQYALIGYNGNGTLSVASGASVTTTQDLNLGSAATGSGTLSVSSGGAVTTGTNAYIGYAGNSSAAVSGADSTWNIGSILYTGFGATGSLAIGSGGTVAADYVDLARNAGSTAAISVNSGGTLSLGGLTQGAGSATMNLAGGTLGIINRSFTTSVPLALAGGTMSTVSISGLAVQFDGVISGNGALAKDGVGIVTLNAANTYSGGTTVNAGTLALAQASALGSTTAPLTLNGGLLDLGGFAPTTGTVVFNGGTFANGTLANAAAFEVRTGSLSAALTGPAALTKTGPGTFTLSGANTYTGATTVSEGTLALGTATTLGNTASVTVNSGATLGLNNLAVALPALGGTGTVDVGSGDLQLGNASDQTLAASLTGSGTLTKVGAGTLTLTGTNAHTGGTRVNAGTIEVGSLAPFGTAAVTLNGGGLRWATGTSADVSSLGLAIGAAGGTLDTNGSDLAFATGLSGTGILTKIGAGTLTLSGANTTGSALVRAGTLALSGATSTLVTGAGIDVGLAYGTAGLALADGGQISSITTTTIGTGDGSNATLSIAGPDTKLTSYGGVFLGYGDGSTATVSITDGGRLTSGASIRAGYEKGSLGTLTVSGAGSKLDTAYALVIGTSGNGALTVSTGGLTAIGGDVTLGQTYLDARGNTGTVDVTGSGSRLEIGGNLTAGESGTGILTIAAGGTVTVGGYATLGGAGTGMAGFGTLNLDGGGTLEIGGTDGLRSGSYTFFNFFTQENITVNGNPTLNLSGGTLKVAGSVLTTSLGATLANTSTIDTNGLGATFRGVLSGAGGLTKTGSGTLTLGAANSYTGATTINAGTLALGAGASLSSSNIHLAGGAFLDGSANGGFTVGSGQTLSGAGTIVGPLALASGSTLSPGSSPGLLTVNGNLSLLGTTLMELAAAGPRGTAYDAVTATGNLTFGGTLTVSLLDSFNPTTGTAFDLFDWTGSTSGTFATLDLPSLGAGLDWDASTLYSDGVLRVASASAVPEPATCAALFGAAALALALGRRHRRAATDALPRQGVLG